MRKMVFSKLGLRFHFFEFSSAIFHRLKTYQYPSHYYYYFILMKKEKKEHKRNHGNIFSFFLAYDSNTYFSNRSPSRFDRSTFKGSNKSSDSKIFLYPVLNKLIVHLIWFDEKNDSINCFIAQKWYIKLQISYTFV